MAEKLVFGLLGRLVLGHETLGETASLQTGLESTKRSHGGRRSAAEIGRLPGAAGNPTAASRVHLSVAPSSSWITTMAAAVFEAFFSDAFMTGF